MKDKSFAVGQFWEYTIQFMSPILLLFWVEKKISKESWLLTAKLCIALSFTCHGLYAVGFYPVPGNFIDMTISILGLTQSQTYIYLFIAGILDFVIAFGIFAPNKKIVKSLLLYATFWGLATTLARIFAYVSFSNFNDTFWQWAPHALYRFPHGLLPLVSILVLLQLEKRNPKSSKTSLKTANK